MDALSVLLTVIKLSVESVGIVALMMLVYALFAPRPGKRAGR